MLTEQTLEKMNGMKLSAMAEAFEQQLSSGEHAKLDFEERIGLLIDCEWTAREQRKLTRRLRAAKPRYKSASLENVDFKHPRGLNRQQVLSLGSCNWIQDQHNLLITGGTDFHGAVTPGLQMGVGRGKFQVAYSMFDGLEDHLSH